MSRRLGCKPRGFDQTIPHYSSLRLARKQMGILMPSVPLSLNWMKGMPIDLGMMLNGPDPTDPSAPELGDCTIAGAHHAKQIWKFNTGGGPLPSPANDNACVLADYQKFCGYVLGDPSTDEGGMEQDVLKGWMTDGMSNPDGTKDKILGFVEIDPRNAGDIRRAIAECGVVYFGASIPEEWEQVSGPGGNWGVSNSPIAGGHCFLGAGFDPDQFLCTSWGINEINMSVDSLRYVNECYAPISSDWIEKTGMTPFGMPLPYLQQTMRSISMAA